MVLETIRALSLRSLAILICRTLLLIASLALVAADPENKWEQPVNCSAARKNLPLYSQLVKLFQYHPQIPEAANVLSTSNDGDLTVQTIEFDFDHGLKCSAELIFPDQKGRFPGVVWLGSDEKQWEQHALEFSKLGAVSILPDWCGNAAPADAHAYYQEHVMMTVNVRRAVDILLSRSDVDPKRIGFVGHSGGTMIGAVAVAVDQRFNAAVFEVGLQGFTYHVCTSPHDPFAIGTRKELDGQLLSWAAVLAPLDTILYVGHEAPTVLLFQSARLDQGVPTSNAQAFFDAASEPKQLKWYDSGHKMELPEVTKDRTEFLRKELGMN
jgi:cephalosporin-C deacetylase-like acetyl esterase